MAIEIRTGIPEDLSLVYACWLRSYKHSSSFAQKIVNSVYYRWHHKIIENILARGAQIRIAHNTGDPETILGFSCLEMFEGKPVVHFVYVKKAFRGEGIAKALVWEREGYFTHMTKNLDLTKHPKLVYCPYLV